MQWSLLMFGLCEPIFCLLGCYLALLYCRYFSVSKTFIFCDSYILTNFGSCQKKKQDGIHCQRPTPPPTAFFVPNINVLYLRETKLWRCGRGGRRRGRGRGGRGGRGENVHLLTHASARGVGKNMFNIPFCCSKHLFSSKLECQSHHL